MQESAAQIDVVLLARSEQPGGDAVDDDADRGDDHDDFAGDRGGIGEAQDRLPGDRSDRQQEKDGVEQRREDRRAAQSVGEAGGGRAPDEPAGEPRGRESEHVAEIMARVGEQRDRAGDQAVGRLDRDEPDIERDADGEGRAEIGRRMGVIVAAVIVAAAPWILGPWP